jgi:uncharacterized membrane protein
MSNNYFNHWYKKIITNGLFAIKFFFGIGFTFALAIKLNPIIAFIFFGYHLTDSLISYHSDK